MVDSLPWPIVRIFDPMDGSPVQRIPLSEDELEDGMLRKENCLMIKKAETRVASGCPRFAHFS